MIYLDTSVALAHLLAEDREVPTVLMVGEIYVRCDPFSNDYAVRRLEERDTADVAKEMDRSENAVRVLYCRALKALKQFLEG